MCLACFLLSRTLDQSDALPPRRPGNSSSIRMPMREYARMIFSAQPPPAMHPLCTSELVIGAGVQQHCNDYSEAAEAAKGWVVEATEVGKGSLVEAAKRAEEAGVQPIHLSITFVLTVVFLLHRLVRRLRANKTAGRAAAATLPLRRQLSTDRDWIRPTDGDTTWTSFTRSAGPADGSGDGTQPASPTIEAKTPVRPDHDWISEDCTPAMTPASPASVMTRSQSSTPIRPDHDWISEESTPAMAPETSPAPVLLRSKSSTPIRPDHDWIRPSSPSVNSKEVSRVPSVSDFSDLQRGSGFSSPASPSPPPPSPPTPPPRGSKEPNVVSSPDREAGEAAFLAAWSRGATGGAERAEPSDGDGSGVASGSADLLAGSVDLIGDAKPLQSIAEIEQSSSERAKAKAKRGGRSPPCNPSPTSATWREAYSDALSKADAALQADAALRKTDLEVLEQAESVSPEPPEADSSKRRLSFSPGGRADTPISAGSAMMKRVMRKITLFSKASKSHEAKTGKSPANTANDPSYSVLRR